MLPSKCCPGKQFRPPKKVAKKNPLQLDGTFELNMELETWIAVDGHHFPNVSRYTCGGVSRPFVAILGKQSRGETWNKIPSNFWTPLSMNTFLKVNHGTSTPVPRGDNGDSL